MASYRRLVPSSGAYLVMTTARQCLRHCHTCTYRVREHGTHDGHGMRRAECIPPGLFWFRAQRARVAGMWTNPLFMSTRFETQPYSVNENREFSVRIT